MEQKYTMDEIIDIINDRECMMDIEYFSLPNKEYGLKLLEVLCKELKEIESP